LNPIENHQENEKVQKLISDRGGLGKRGKRKL